MAAYRFACWICKKRLIGSAGAHRCISCDVQLQIQTKYQAQIPLDLIEEISENENEGE